MHRHEAPDPWKHRSTALDRSQDADYGKEASETLQYIVAGCKLQAGAAFPERQNHCVQETLHRSR